MVDYPQNAWTKLIERAREMNELQGGGGGLASASPRPSVTSAAFHRAVEDTPELSPEEQQRRDQIAREMGLMPGGPEEVVEYATMEEALAAAGAERGMDEAPVVLPLQHAGMLDPRFRGIQAVAQQPLKVVEMPRFPDFSKVQGIDLVVGEAFIDSMKFSIPPEALRKMRQYIVELARVEIMKKLDEAMGLFGPEAKNEQGASSTVSPLQSVVERGRKKPTV